MNRTELQRSLAWLSENSGATTQDVPADLLRLWTWETDSSDPIAAGTLLSVFAHGILVHNSNEKFTCTLDQLRERFGAWVFKLHLAANLRAVGMQHQPLSLFDAHEEEELVLGQSARAVPKNPREFKVRPANSPRHLDIDDQS